MHYRDMQISNWSRNTVPKDKVLEQIQNGKQILSLIKILKLI